MSSSLSCSVWVFYLLKYWGLTPGLLNQNCKGYGSGSQPGQFCFLGSDQVIPVYRPVLASEVLHLINLLSPRQTVKVDYQHVWLSELGAGYCHLVGGGQGGCRTSSNAWDGLSQQRMIRPKMSVVPTWTIADWQAGQVWGGASPGDFGIFPCWRTSALDVWVQSKGTWLILTSVVFWEWD